MSNRISKQDDTAVVIKHMYRRREAAFSLGLSVRSIDAMLADGRLKSRRWGSRVLIPAGEVKRVADRIMRQDDLRGQGEGGSHAQAS